VGHRRRGATGGLPRSRRLRSRSNRQGHSTGIRRASHRRGFALPPCQHGSSSPRHLAKVDALPPRRRGFVVQAPPRPDRELVGGEVQVMRDMVTRRARWAGRGR
jgi:hypothetical protein